MRNIRLRLEYDGTAYVGWQRQMNGRSVQGEIEGVLVRVLQEAVSVIGAGRTDAGVHARGQVGNFRTASHLTTNEIHRALNGLLPDDIIVHEAQDVPLEFHARYSAKARRYSYLISRGPTALLRHQCWVLKYRLDVAKMQTCAEWILGEHDFASFCRTQADVDHHSCTVGESKWVEEGTYLRYEITANRFLHGMVRALVGTMVDVGRGHRSMEEFMNILSLRDRRAAGMAAPALGLVLEKVIY